MHSPYTVRSDTVDTIRSVLDVMSNDPHDATISDMLSNHNTTETVCPATDLVRPVDVVHMWEIGKHYNSATLREDVSKVVSSLNGTTTHNNNKNKMVNGRYIHTSTKLQGSNAGAGRNTVSTKYVQALLQTKIVVVAQRDKWEDHYRLMEGLSAGALVVMDVMLGLPSGLIDGQHVIIYHDLDQLREQILYYLQHDEERIQIAKNGWEVAMSRHRSYHRIEELVFGCPRTKVNMPYKIY